jgi:hypothetical protein
MLDLSAGERDAKTFAMAYTGRDYLDEKLRLTAVTLMKNPFPDKKPPPTEVDETDESTTSPSSMASKSVVFAPWESMNWGVLAFTRTQLDRGVVSV